MRLSSTPFHWSHPAEIERLGRPLVASTLVVALGFSLSACQIERSPTGSHDAAPADCLPSVTIDCDDYTPVVQKAPDNASTFYNRAVGRTEVGDYDGAVQDYSRAIELDPNLPLAYLNRGSARVSLGDRPNGIRDIEKAGELFQSFGDEASYQQVQQLLKDV